MYDVFFENPLLIVLVFLPILPNLWAILHIFKHDFQTAQEKMAWIAVAVFIPVLGGLAYLFFGRRRVVNHAEP
ncbi:PLDc N-terminal domain-containing protein [Desulfonatronovibrio hydrogenovorans]|uniref:PLDc N-terminal domain-containing protein n=1 Tax=Desulfonatronovibrio hydrogenovorans TaxID=53245 RepID=UPI000490C600|nr:PLD nuclease N-terminal domain-containing protein [Desulfonatronovibrio hydrogenovorans]